MKKRIVAWILLAGFVLLLLNLFVFKVYLEFSLMVYIIIAFAFIITKGRLFSLDDVSEEESNSKESDKVSNEESNKKSDQKKQEG